jgi:addiction module HigA family antidote
MKATTHPGTLLKKRLKEAKIRANFLAGKIGVANSQFVDILNGKRRLTPRVAIGLERELGIRALDLVRLQAEYDLAAEKMLELTEMVEVAKVSRARAY